MLPANKTITEISSAKTQIESQPYNIEYELNPSVTYIFPYKFYKFIEQLVTPTKLFPCEECNKKEEMLECYKKENAQLKNENEFLRTELNRLQTELIKKTRKVSLIPFEEILLEHTKEPNNKIRIDKARSERQKEWLKMVKAGKMSKIKYYRMLKGMDQLTFARKLGMAQPNVSRLERPGYNVPVKTLAKIAKILKVPMEVLIE
jgi:DNA-binding XRE family transcriptional regulator